MLPTERLFQHAAEARLNAYAPYSGYKVGAALESETGEISVGCNIENLSYGATICAERAAITAMIAQSRGKRVAQIAVASIDGVTPCGICLQVLNEFADGETLVHCLPIEGPARTFKLGDLMPHAFASSKVGRTETDPKAV